MDMIFGNPIRETFKGVGMAGGRDVSNGVVGSEYIPNTKITNSGFLAAKIPENSRVKSEDDQPLHFGFSF